MRYHAIVFVIPLILCFAVTAQGEPKELRIRYSIGQSKEHLKPEAGKDEVTRVYKTAADLKKQIPKAFAHPKIRKVDFDKQMVIYLQKNYKKTNVYYLDVAGITDDKDTYTVRWSVEEIPLGAQPLKPRACCKFLIVDKHNGKPRYVFEGFKPSK